MAPRLLYAVLMLIRVLFFGMLKDLTGRAKDTLELRAGATVADLLAHYGEDAPRVRDFLPALAVSVNQEYARRDAVLHDQDEVALLPPVSGGSDPQATASRAALVRTPIDTARVVESMRRPSDGAVVVFEGTVFGVLVGHWSATVLDGKCVSWEGIVA